MKTEKEQTINIGVKLSTYHLLSDIVQRKKEENLSKNGTVGNANFDGVIRDILKNKKT